MTKERLIALLVALCVLVFILFLIRSYNRTVKRYRLSKIDKMSGAEFEAFMRKVYRSMGYTVKSIGGVGDFGADLIIEKRGTRTAVQAKRYSYKVDLKAVQQVFSAQYYYDCDASIVVTNSYYTRAAKKLASKINVKLVDRDELESMIRRKRKPVQEPNVA